MKTGITEVLRTVDVTLMPAWVKGEKYPVSSAEPARRLQVRIGTCEGLYGYEIDDGVVYHFDWYGDEKWRDRYTAIAFCEHNAWYEVAKRFGAIRAWEVRQ